MDREKRFTKPAAVRAAMVASTASVVLAAGLLAGAAPAEASTPPSVTPTVTPKIYSNAGNVPACSKEFVCALVPYGGKYYVFNFKNYGTHYLHHWSGQGEVTNNQTGGAAFRTYREDGSPYKCFPVAPVAGEVKWDPVWSVALTEKGC